MTVFKPAVYFLFFSLLIKVSFSQKTNVLLWLGLVLSHIFPSSSLLHPGGGVGGVSD